MTTIQHELISDFLKLGCPQLNAALSYQIYVDLCTNKQLTDINYRYNETLQRMYLTAKFPDSEESSLIIPISSTENISFDTIQSLFAPGDVKKICLAIAAPDSTAVYYNLTNHLLDTASIAEKRKKIDRCKFVENPKGNNLEKNMTAENLATSESDELHS